MDKSVQTYLVNGLEKDKQITQLKLQLLAMERRMKYYQIMLKSCQRQLKNMRMQSYRSRATKRKLNTDLKSQSKKRKTISVQTDLTYCGSFNNDLMLKILNRVDKPKSQPYSEEERQFAFRQHFLSPAAYRALRKRLQNCIPNERTFVNWTKSFQVKPGN